MAIEFYGETISETPDDANVPVNLFIAKVRQGGKVKYRLSYDFWMPRRCTGCEGGYALADTHDEIKGLLKERVLPLYAAAFKHLTQMTEGTRDSLYYWMMEEKPLVFPSDEAVLRNGEEVDCEEEEEAE